MTDTKKIYCSECGSKNEIYAKFCPNCGNSLKAGVKKIEVEAMVNEEEEDDNSVPIVAGVTLNKFAIREMVNDVEFLGGEPTKMKVSDLAPSPKTIEIKTYDGSEAKNPTRIGKYKDISPKEMRRRFLQENKPDKSFQDPTEKPNGGWEE